MVGQFLPLWNPLRVFFWRILGASLTVLEHSWRPLVASWRLSGPSLCRLKPFWLHLEAQEGESKRKSTSRYGRGKHSEKTPPTIPLEGGCPVQVRCRNGAGMVGQFLPLWNPLRVFFWRILGASLTVLEHSWRPLVASWRLSGPSLCRLKPFWLHLEAQEGV